MSERMIEIKGQKISESTIIEALRKHCGFQETYQFQAGDVARNRWGEWRIIVRDSVGRIISCSINGRWEGTNQDTFEFCGYQKVATFSELIECWEKHNV